MSATSKLGAGWPRIKAQYAPLNAYGTKLGDPEVACIHGGHPFRVVRSISPSGTKYGASECDYQY